MADKIIVKETGPAPSGTPGGGLYLIVGALLVAVVVGGFLMFGMPGSGPGGVATSKDSNVNVTIQQPKAPAPAAPAAPAPAAPAPASR